jgi:hypothetical protein
MRGERRQKPRAQTPARRARDAAGRAAAAAARSHTRTVRVQQPHASRAREQRPGARRVGVLKCSVGTTTDQNALLARCVARRSLPGTRQPYHVRPAAAGPRGRRQWRRMTRQGSGKRARRVRARSPPTPCRADAALAAGGAARAQGARAPPREEARGGALCARAEAQTLRPRVVSLAARSRAPLPPLAARQGQGQGGAQGGAEDQGRPAASRRRGALAPPQTRSRNMRLPARGARSPARPARRRRRTGCTATRPSCATSASARRCRRRPWAPSCCRL